MSATQEFREEEFFVGQVMDGVPLLKSQFEGFESYGAAAYPSEMKKVSDNESYAIIKGKSKAVKITVKTTGSGDVRRDPVVTLEEVEMSDSSE